MKIVLRAIVLPVATLQLGSRAPVLARSPDDRIDEDDRLIGVVDFEDLNVAAAQTAKGALVRRVREAVHIVCAPAGNSWPAAPAAIALGETHGRILRPSWPAPIQYPRAPDYPHRPSRQVGAEGPAGLTAVA